MGPRLDSRGNELRRIRRNAGPALQWGRDLIVAETLIATADANTVLIASMGPRLDSRGNEFENRRIHRGHSVLQWGRDLIVAETCRDLRQLRGRGKSFNGAAT